MKTIPAQEIKRRGISAVDEFLSAGSVHVIKNNRPQYVVLSEARYQALLDIENDAHVAGVRESLEEYKAGQTTRGSADDLVRELGLEE